MDPVSAVTKPISLRAIQTMQINQQKWALEAEHAPPPCGGNETKWKKKKKSLKLPAPAWAEAPAFCLRTLGRGVSEPSMNRILFFYK